MTNRQQYRIFLLQLQAIYNLNEATIITDWVLESLAGIQRFDVVKEPEKLLPDTITVALEVALAALLKHKPVQYVTREAWFYNMKLKVDEHVLIPRPETEELVKLVLDAAKDAEVLNPSILDIGTGSGCIAIAVKKNLPAASITAIDVSESALAIAKDNAAVQQTEIKFLKINFLEESQWASLPVFDVLISNPPYIPMDEKEKMDKNVTSFEPHQALFVPDRSPLLFYEKIAHEHSKYATVTMTITLNHYCSVLSSPLSILIFFLIFFLIIFIYFSFNFFSQDNITQKMSKTKKRCTHWRKPYNRWHCKGASNSSRKGYGVK